MKKQIALLLGAAMLCGAGNAAEVTNKTKPQVYMVADAHLDTQWNWDIQRTIKEYVWNTISQNLFLMKQYPDYVFNFEGGVKYSWMKEYYPREYEELKGVIKSGQWHISGASWDADDVIVPSIESQIRNILLGQTYYRQEFGVESTDIFLPDCFGFGWTLPTVASHCGLIGFSSQKLQWRYHPFYGDAKYPFLVGLWQGIDGSKIMFAHCNDYTARWNDEDLTENKDLKALVESCPLGKVNRYYGTGDIGGSPTITSVRAVEKGLKGKGPIEIVSATSDQLYKEYQPYSSHPELQTFNGELLMDVHGTGCYTSQGAMKMYNRQNELLGDAAERASVAAEWLNQANYPGEELTNLWRRTILHQFHDDLTGTSIPRAYEFSWNDELLTLKQFSNVLTTSMGAMSGLMDTRVKGVPVVLYNALGYAVKDIVEIEVPSAKKVSGVTVYGPDGKEAASQLVGMADGKVRVLVEATVPATGSAVYDVVLKGKTVANKAAATNKIENSVYALEFDANGDITSLKDKRNGKELVKPGKAFRLAMFTDNKSAEWPSWEVMKATIDKEPVAVTGDVKITAVEDGNLRKTVCVEKRAGGSAFKQYIRLYEGARADRIDFYNEIDWREENTLLKAEFPLNIENEKATYDLGLGSVERGNNTETAYEVYSQGWADLSNRSGSHGVTIMNDSKYGWDKPNDNTLRLTLLHTPGVTNRYEHQKTQDHGYHCFTYSLMPHAGVLDKAMAVENTEILNQKIKGVVVDKHQGALGKEFSFVKSDNKNVVIKALKKAEASDEYVVRVYEIGGKDEQHANLTFAGQIAEAVEADGTEKTLGGATYDGRNLKVDIKPFSVKTYKVKLGQSDQKAYAQTTEVMDLPYNVKCSTFNEFRGEANFENGYSYAAELLPERIEIDRVTFKLGDKVTYNGLKCNGDTLVLPAGKKYNKLYILAAAAGDDTTGEFVAGKSKTSVEVPSYSGFVGQWGHEGHTKGYFKNAEVAYVGTHRHAKGGDAHYELTYMFKYGIDIPAGATSVILPKNDKIVIFAATLANEREAQAKTATELFRTAIK